MVIVVVTRQCLTDHSVELMVLRIACSLVLGSTVAVALTDDDDAVDGGGCCCKS